MTLVEILLLAALVGAGITAIWNAFEASMLRSQRNWEMGVMHEMQEVINGNAELVAQCVNGVNQIGKRVSDLQTVQDLHHKALTIQNLPYTPITGEIMKIVEEDEV